MHNLQHQICLVEAREFLVLDDVLERARGVEQAGRHGAAYGSPVAQHGHEWHNA